VGQGSTFSFTIPLADTSVDDIESRQEAAPAIFVEEETKSIEDTTFASTQKAETVANILAVDDDPVNLKVLTNILGEDYSVTTAVSGEQALTFLDTGEWDLVISDVMMPNMSGYELTQII